MKRSQRGGIISRLLTLLMLIAVLGVVYLLRHPLLRAAGSFLVVDEAPQPSDAILLLSDDNYYADRAARAAELYHGHWAPRIIACGRRLRPYAGIAELMQRDLVERGVPADAVIRFPHSGDNTREEAESLRGLVLERGWHRILLVTSSCHTRRARYIYHRVFPPSVEVRVISARDAYYDPDHWWETRRGVKLFFIETVGSPWPYGSCGTPRLPWSARQRCRRHPPVPDAHQGWCFGLCTGAARRPPFPVYTPPRLYYIPTQSPLSELPRYCPRLLRLQRDL